MYNVDDEMKNKVFMINEVINSKLRRFLQNPFVTKPKFVDFTGLSQYTELLDKTRQTVTDLTKEYSGSNLYYIEEQLENSCRMLHIIRKNIFIIDCKISLEYIFNRSVAWDEYALLYTEYNYEVTHLDEYRSEDRVIREMYDVLFGHNVTKKEFFNNCTACGGDWVSMLLSGIERCFHDDYYHISITCDDIAIDDDGGFKRFAYLCDYLKEHIADWETE